MYKISFPKIYCIRRAFEGERGKFPADLVTITEEILNGKLHFFVQWFADFLKISKIFTGIHIFCVSLKLQVRTPPVATCHVKSFVLAFPLTKGKSRN